MNWLAKTNQMWTSNDFAAVDQITAGQMNTLYQSEQPQASLPKNASQVAFQLTGLSITIPCHAGAATVFVAYADTDVFDLGSSVQSVAMVFERTGGLWKLATAVNHADGSGWPALCTQRMPPTAAPELAPGSYTSDLARVLTRADSGAAQTTQTASPFAVNDFLAGPARSPRCPPPRSGRTGRAESRSPEASPRLPARRSHCRWPTAAASGSSAT